jgi:hypothetical protein
MPKAWGGNGMLFSATVLFDFGDCFCHVEF